jgi:hypothetical protein
MSSLFNLRNFLLAAAAALLVALGIETDWGASLTLPASQARAVGAKHDSAAVLPDFRLGSEANAYNQIVERPLLNPNRKPAPTQVVTAAPEPPKPQVRRGLYQLIGITDLGPVKIAQVREVASNRVKSVRQGDQLQEMTVAKIEPTQVTLAFQGETDVIEMAKFTASGRVPQPSAPPPQPLAAAPQPAPQPPPGLPPQPNPNPTGLPLSALIPGVLAAQGGVAAAPASTPTPPVAAEPPKQREVMNVVELMERRRLARQQAGGQ